jgi:hypothetical protein
LDVITSLESTEKINSAVTGSGSGIS